MTDGLIKLSALAEILEYKDSRSVLNWCKKHKINVIKAGKARYVASVQIDEFFEKQISNDKNSNRLTQGYLKTGKKIKQPHIDISKRSKAAQDFLRNLGMA